MIYVNADVDGRIVSFSHKKNGNSLYIEHKYVCFLCVKRNVFYFYFFFTGEKDGKGVAKRKIRQTLKRHKNCSSEFMKMKWLSTQQKKIIFINKCQINFSVKFFYEN